MRERIIQQYFIGVGLVIFILPYIIVGQDTITAQTLPSVVTLTIQKTDGTKQIESGFLTIRDGIVATALHVVKDARRVTARFSAGEEYECTGIIDKDEVRDVALIRIKVFGRPMLKLTGVNPAVGTILRLAAVKDSAFGLMPVAITDVAANDGTKWVQLDGDIPAGNSGGPIMDEHGNVVGILTLKKVEARLVGYLIPAGYILALDNSLPTKPWDQATSANSGAPVSISPGAAERGREKPNLSNEEVDRLIGAALREIVDSNTSYVYAQSLIGSSAPSLLYETQMSLKLIFSKFTEVRTIDPLRTKLAASIPPIINAQYEASENLIKAMSMGVSSPPANDLLQRSLAQQRIVTKMINEIVANLLELEKDSAVFREFLPAEQRLHLGLMPPTSGIRMSIINSVKNPFYLLNIVPGGLAEKIGLERGDKIISVGGKTFSNNDSIEDLRLILKQSLGKKLDAVVQRHPGKVISLKLVIPAILPADPLSGYDYLLMSVQ